ncbi:MAG: bifunctional DNA-formamidopyrimidine glycosylase/DNA-(apurinic or apyrimidinic site) lyase [Proteobacteria bacterium]|nr:MAG: bifunctional DNA-formamidopyrimidine glycosylase/DNA-(apurinic or apyrimidinic site) lyase [Pseudomonadota bacterium]
MPELPEVETTRRGIEPHLLGRTVTAVVVHQPRLRRRVPARLGKELTGQRIDTVARRGKYLLIGTEAGTLILHLGMSGSLRIVAGDAPLRPHDHLEFAVDNGRCLRLHDPRRFGLALWTTRDPLQHVLLSKLGPEPLSDEFSGAHLYAHSRNRRIAVKPFIMDSHIVVGVGNIYASEALFRAGIDPRRAAGRIARARYQRLAAAITSTLDDALRQGGTTLRDYLNSDGEPGYFRLHLNVYERAAQPCRVCRTPIRQLRQGQRSSYYCPNCQH